MSPFWLRSWFTLNRTAVFMELLENMDGRRRTGGHKRGLINGPQEVQDRLVRGIGGIG